MSVHKESYAHSSQPDKAPLPLIIVITTTITTIIITMVVVSKEYQSKQPTHARQPLGHASYCFRLGQTVRESTNVTESEQHS